MTALKICFNHQAFYKDNYVDCPKCVNDYKNKARKKLENAVRDGKVAKPDWCTTCGKEAIKISGHHRNYDNPLSVMWLCTKCHSEQHLYSETKYTLPSPTAKKYSPNRESVVHR